ncbi:MAG: hypothetical protein V4692_03475 [Bdellovibrionota bacterium]
MKQMIFTCLTAVIVAMTAVAEAETAGPKTETEIDGVWLLTEFTITDTQGNVTEWCEGSYGVIMYTEGYMSTAINCKSDPKKVLLYSGPFEFAQGRVTHHARNFSDPSLNRAFDRSARIEDDQLTLSGTLGDGGTATVKWLRR